MPGKVIPFSRPEAPTVVLGEVVYRSSRLLQQLQIEVLDTMIWELKQAQVLPPQNHVRDLEAAALVAVLMASDLLPAIESRLRKAVADYALFAPEAADELG